MLLDIKAGSFEKPIREEIRRELGPGTECHRRLSRRSPAAAMILRMKKPITTAVLAVLVSLSFRGHNRGCWRNPRQPHRPG